MFKIVLEVFTSYTDAIDKLSPQVQEKLGLARVESKVDAIIRYPIWSDDFIIIIKGLIITVPLGQ